ncbi:hypothetical protein AO721_02840 [Aeromonas veronii]|nr:hypothetical protein AMS64_12570 [Aeromonas veronii]KRV68238.1 hypothetical protein AO728_14915 [Aeromonas veronii]KRV79294.1 hypothetical protein AO719_02655 [Aeromonas veronii]KRV90898.1 hypothetical protein AO721_02840 [Aeromonas veronii]KRV92176.1 hypothetical protein AO739_02045 [Aeromonas veronii]
MSQRLLFDLAIEPAVQGFTSPVGIAQCTQLFSDLLLVVDFQDFIHQMAIFSLAFAGECLIFFRCVVCRGG